MCVCVCTYVCACLHGCVCVYVSILLSVCLSFIHVYTSTYTHMCETAQQERRSIYASLSPSKARDTHMHKYTHIYDTYTKYHIHTNIHYMHTQTNTCVCKYIFTGKHNKEGGAHTHSQSRAKLRVQGRRGACKSVRSASSCARFRCHC